VLPQPVPPSSAKLRVYVTAFTLGDRRMMWGTPHEEFADKQVRIVEKHLQRTGIYEVVERAAVSAALGDQFVPFEAFERRDWALGREIGRALHADYLMAVARNKERGMRGGTFIFSCILINTKTGQSYRSRYALANVTGADREQLRMMTRATYREIFAQAKEDMLAVAVRKGKAYAPPGPQLPEKPRETPVIVRAEPAPVPAPQPPVPASEPAVAVQVPASRDRMPPEPEPVQEPQSTSPNLPGAGVIDEQEKGTGTARVVVYDLEASEQYRTAALILAEALREEIFKLNRFVLVNREDLMKVLDEIALQQTGLIDEKQAVATGKGLAASQVVTGRLGQLGKTFVMQAKRVDVETLRTLGLASAKFTEGQEEAVLNELPAFARTLAGLQ
jgi:hypothetical protein